MKKILTLSIALIIVAGIVSLAKSADIDTDTGGPATAYPKDRHIVKTSTGVVVIYWRAFSPTGIRGKKSTDNGATWTKLDGTPSGSTLIGVESGNSFSICLDSSTNNIYVAYNESDDIYFTKLTYSVSGGTWTVQAERSVTSTGEDEDAAYPSIIRESDGDIWVSYGYWEMAYGGGLLRSNYSTDEFQSSNIIRNVSSWDSGAGSSDYGSALVIRNSVPFVVYADMDTIPNCFKWSYWTGTSWASTGTVTTDSPFSADDFSITMVGSDVHFVYNQSGAGIKHRYYNGTSWSDPATTLSANTNDKNVSLATDGSNLWCFISEYVAANSYNIKYKMRSSGTWDGSWTAITTDNADNLYSTPPPSTTGYIPLAWTKGTNPATVTVKFSSSVVTGDTASPAAITNLSGLCDSQTGDVTLYWSTPGDDGWNNTLPSGSKYRIDYSSYSIAWSTNTFDVEISTSGVAPYTQVSHTITGLTGDSTYYFRIWTADEVPNWSGLSNGATVWVNPILSISISTDTYAFGTMVCTTSTVSGSTITVTNEGNVTETYSIMCSSTTKWTPQNTPGPNQFTLQSAFHSSQPADNDLIWKADDILTESLQPCTTAAFSIDNSESGKNVPPFNGDIKKLWFRLKTPLSTSTTNQQTITITISAQSP